MRPKYTSVAALISFDIYPSDTNLMLAVQDSYYALIEEFDFLDPESGSLSVPIDTQDGKIVYIYTMRAMGDSEILYDGDPIS